MIPGHELGEDIRAAVASYETEGGRTKIKFWNKVDALDKAIRHLGLFEHDNRQQGQNLAIQINLVEGKRPADPVEISARPRPGSRAN